MARAYRKRSKKATPKSKGCVGKAGVQANRMKVALPVLSITKKVIQLSRFRERITHPSVSGGQTLWFLVGVCRDRSDFARSPCDSLAPKLRVNTTRLDTRTHPSPRYSSLRFSKTCCPKDAGDKCTTGFRPVIKSVWHRLPAGDPLAISPR